MKWVTDMKARYEKEAKQKNPKRVIALALTAVLLLGGIGVIAYPHAEQYLFAQQAKKDYEVFLETRQELTFDPASGSDTDIQQYPELYKLMQEYNEQLSITGQAGLTDPWAYEQTSFDLSEYGLEEDIIGYIEIPKIDVVLPIYLGASPDNMTKGAAHLSETSLPIGGGDTNSVICAHRNYSKAAQFTRLPELEPGDEVIVTNLWYSMIYRVTGTAMILDDDIDSLKIQDGKDMLSLFTCYYNGDRKDRFVAFCERADEQDAQYDDASERA